MSGRNIRRTTLWLILGLVILGCASPVLVTPPPSIPQPGAVETIIVETAAAAQAQTVTLLPSPTSTSTMTPLPRNTATNTPTSTATIIFVTNTSLPEGLLADGTDEADDGEGSGSDGYVKPTATPNPWECSILSKSPANNTVMRGGSSFKATWTVRNTGSKTWPIDGVDVAFHSGAHLEEGKPYYDIPTAVGPGGTVSLSVSMRVPKRSNVYSTRWALRVGKLDFCQVKFTIEVE